MTPADTLVAPVEDLTTLSHDRRSELTRQLLEEAHRTDDDERHRALLDRVVVVNHRIARAVAARYQGRGVADDDLEQAACEGLVKAAAHFDPTLRHDFLSYAVPTIRGEVQRYFRDHGWTVRPPRRLQQLQWQLNRTTEDLCVELGREPTPEELRARMEIDEETHREVVASFGCFQPTSLDQPVAASPDLRLGDTLAASAARRRRAASTPPRPARPSPRCCGSSRSATARSCSCATTRTGPSRRSASCSGSPRCRSPGC